MMLRQERPWEASTQLFAPDPRPHMSSNRQFPATRNEAGQPRNGLGAAILRILPRVRWKPTAWRGTDALFRRSQEPVAACALLHSIIQAERKQQMQRPWAYMIFSAEPVHGSCSRVLRYG